MFEEMIKEKRSEGGGRDGGQDDEEGKITAKEEGKTTKTKTMEKRAMKTGRGKESGDHGDDGHEDKGSDEEDGKTKVLKITDLT